jgi:hypothetical protein
MPLSMISNISRLRVKMKKRKLQEQEELEQEGNQRRIELNSNINIKVYPIRLATWPIKSGYGLFIVSLENGDHLGF